MKKNNDQTSEDNRDSGVLSNPLSFLRSGLFYWDSASLSYRGSNGNYWSLRSANTTASNYLNFSNTFLHPQYHYNHGFGFAVRCVGTSKSFTTLINTSYSMKNTSQALETNDRDSGVLSSPLSFVHSGRYSYSDSTLIFRGGNGNFWSLRSYSVTPSHDLGVYSASLNPQDNTNRGMGFAVHEKDPFRGLFCLPVFIGVAKIEPECTSRAIC